MKNMPKNYHVRELAYFKTGGPARAVCLPESIEDAAALLKKIHAEGAAYYILGLGSNSLAMDTPWDGYVISLAAMEKMKLQGSSLYCEAGVINSAIAQEALCHGLGGAGWMYRLPGQLGGTVRMNARCYGGEIGQIVSSLVTVAPDGTIHHYSNTQNNKEIFCGYKDTIFMRNGHIILAATLELAPADPIATKKLMDHCESDRVAKQQFNFPNCGCVFKNDHSPEVSISSGLLLDKAGAKKLRFGGAEVSPYHANFIYNKGATSNDILELSLLMREAVWKEFGVWMEYEMEILGTVPAEIAQRIAEKRNPKPQETKLAAIRAEFQQKLGSKLS